MFPRYYFNFDVAQSEAISFLHTRKQFVVDFSEWIQGEGHPTGCCCLGLDEGADVMARYQVIVGNIGTVYDGNNMIDANRDYGTYKRQSIAGYGRAGGESVTLMDNDEPKFEYIPSALANIVRQPSPALPVITEEMYLDWVNDHLTVEHWAEHHGLDDVEAARTALEKYRKTRDTGK